MTEADRSLPQIAVIPAAGLGKRLRPATRLIPKPMLPLIDRPAIDLVVREIFDAGVEQVALVIGWGGETIRKYFEAEPEFAEGRIHFVEQPEPLGLGDAILRGAEIVGDRPFVVAFGDAVFLENNPTRQLVDDFAERGEAILGVRTVPREDVYKYGVLHLSPGSVEDGITASRLRVVGMVEKPRIEVAPSRLAMAGRYIFHPSLFEALRDVAPDAGGEVQLTPAVNAVAARENVAALTIEEPRLDIGNPRDYYAAIREYARRRLKLDD